MILPPAFSEYVPLTYLRIPVGGESNTEVNPRRCKAWQVNASHMVARYVSSMYYFREFRNGNSNSRFILTLYSFIQEYRRRSFNVTRNVPVARSWVGDLKVDHFGFHEAQFLPWKGQAQSEVMAC
jgi:hypothetical protein